MIKGAVRWKRLGESVQRVFSLDHESKCSSQKTGPRECEGYAYLYPPQKKYGGVPRLKSSEKSKKVGLFSWTPSRQTLLRLEQTGCPGYSVEWNTRSLWGPSLRRTSNFRNECTPHVPSPTRFKGDNRCKMIEGLL